MEKIVRLVSVTIFPDHISISLQQLPGIHIMPVSELIEWTCILMQKDTRDVVCMVMKMKMKMTERQKRNNRKKNEARKAG